MSKSRPGRLFKYQPFSMRTLENLKNRTLWFSSPTHFNDPFDCGASAIPNPSDGELEQLFSTICRSSKNADELRELYLEVQSGVLKPQFRQDVRRGLQAASHHHFRPQSRGVACLTETPTDLLMWAHYGDGHRGLCLEFDAAADPFNRAKPVKYSEKFPFCDFMSLVLAPLDGPTNPDVLRGMFLTKAECWRYEREWRILHQEASLAYGYGKALIVIHCGAAMPLTHVDMIRMLIRGTATELCELKRREDTFAVESERLE